MRALSPLPAARFPPLNPLSTRLLLALRLPLHQLLAHALRGTLEAAADAAAAQGALPGYSLGPEGPGGGITLGPSGTAASRPGRQAVARPGRTPGPEPPAAAAQDGGAPGGGGPTPLAPGWLAQRGGLPPHSARLWAALLGTLGVEPLLQVGLPPFFVTTDSFRFAVSIFQLTVSAG
jgi:hypothetical protein